MESKYDHQKFEQEIYKRWESSGAFKPGNGKKPYTILMPPPNANASLHAGHAMYTVDDVLIRWKRMQGFSAQWLPGMDHAGFETQFVYEKHLAKEDKSRMDFGRQTLYDNIHKFVLDNSGLIYEQFKRLGFSADWSRSVFTLDDQVLKQVHETFIKMEKEGLVYRDQYIVNFCPHCGTSLAELEVLHEEKNDPLIYMKYGPFVIATVRPETKFRDTALAVNPNDKRYKKHIGKVYEIMGLLGPVKMTVIPDREVDPEFGTGIMKVTPAHDPHDFELGKKLNLPVTPIIDTSGRMDFSWFLSQKNIPDQYRQRAENYHHKKVAEVRKLMIEDLKQDGLLIKIDEKYSHRISVCYKCKRVLEPLVIPNWFIKVSELKKPVIDAVNKNRVRFYPERFKQRMLDWLNIMHDWPISRQIAWGIRLPIWYKVDNKEQEAGSKNQEIEIKFIDKNKKLIRGNIGELLKTYPLSEIKDGLQELRAPAGTEYIVSVSSPENDCLQETDTFDTWFSSGQWPLVTLNDEELKNRFPTDMLGTLSDILRFWVSRMIMFSLYLKKEIPFKDVYLWSMVADAKGVKMSKSKGNVVNPIELVDKYGADALRMTLLHGTASGSAIALSEDKVRGMRNFSNKIWNAARYVASKDPTLSSQGRILSDAEFMKKLDIVVKTVTKNLKEYRLGLAAETVYNEFWHWFCDEAIEKNKKNELSDKAIFEGLTTFLKLLHPFMPFVTEAVWTELGNKEMLITSKWPK